MDRLVALTGLACLFAGAAAADSPAEGPPPPGPPAPVASDPAPLFDAPAQRFLPWLGVQYSTSPQLADRRLGYTGFDAFVPYYQWDNGLFFLNAQGFVNNDDDWGSNLGGGLRWYNASTGRILGGNAYWDTRDTGPNSFNQVGGGVESLSRYLDFRANGYVPLGGTQPVNAVAFTDPRFFEHFILLSRHNFGQAALSGFDTELGGTLPRLEPYGLRAYAGVYSYQGPNTAEVVGGHVRLEERLTDDIDLNLTVNSDPLLHTTVLFGAAIRFGGEGRRGGSSRGDVHSRLVDRIFRNDTITVVNQEVTTPVLATNPCTNAPIIVDHAASYAAAGGDGTFEHPYNTLPQLQAGSHPGDILFVWANSVFTGQNITLQNNQRFLGEGLPYPFTATQGTFLLPRATAFTNAPVIQNAPGNAVTLANNNEVAGFVVRGAAQDGIFGSGVTDFYIHNNVITGSGLNGIVLLDLGPNGFVPPCMASGPTNVIADNVVSNNGDMVSAVAGGPLFGEGIYLQGSAFSGSITGNTANNNGDLSGGAAVATVFDNSAGLSATFGQGIAVNVSGAFTGNISGNTANGNCTIGAPTTGGVGVNTASGGTTTFGQGIAVNAGAFTGNISGNTADGNGAFGTVSDSSRGVFNTGTTTTFGQGVAVSAGTFTGDISGNTADGNGAFGPVSGRGVTSFANGGATATTTFGQGVAVNAATFNGSISGNTADGNGAFGAVSGNGVQNLTNFATGTTTFGQGVAVNATTFNGSINGNTADGNGAFGAVSGSGVNSLANGATGTTTFGQGVAVNATTFNGSINGNTTDGNGAFGAVSGSGVINLANGATATTTFGQGVAVNATTFNGSINGNTADGNGAFGAVSGSGVINLANRATATTTFGQGVAVNATTFNGSISGNTADGNGAFGTVSVGGFGVHNFGGTTTFGQGVLLQAVNGTATLADNTLMNNAQGQNVDVFGGSAVYGQGMLLEGSGSGDFFAFVQNNRFGGNNGNDSDNSPSQGTDLFALYTGSGKMGVELQGNTTTSPVIPPAYNYFFQRNSGLFQLEDDQGTTGGNGSVGTSGGVTSGHVPF